MGRIGAAAGIAPGTMSDCARGRRFRPRDRLRRDWTFASGDGWFRRASASSPTDGSSPSSERPRPGRQRARARLLRGPLRRPRRSGLRPPTSSPTSRRCVPSATPPIGGSTLGSWFRPRATSGSPGGRPFLLRHAPALRGAGLRVPAGVIPARPPSSTAPGLSLVGRPGFPELLSHFELGALIFDRAFAALLDERFTATSLRAARRHSRRRVPRLRRTRATRPRPPPCPSSFRGSAAYDSSRPFPRLLRVFSLPLRSTPPMSRSTTSRVVKPIVRASGNRPVSTIGRRHGRGVEPASSSRAPDAQTMRTVFEGLLVSTSSERSASAAVGNRVRVTGTFLDAHRRSIFRARRRL